jgi:SDR family mycofactocin-dependent oxidoreductase
VSTRSALVTGAGRGIGAATTLALARRGWSVLAVDLAADDPRLPYSLSSAADLDAVAAQDVPGRIVPFVADCADEVAMAAAVARAEEEFGGLDAVLAVAGVIAGGVPLWEMPAAELDAVLGTDLVGVVVTARVGIPALLRRPVPRSGRFVAVASAAATRGMPMLAAYSAAKAGVAGLVRGLAVELAGTGVTANAVSPGSTDTPILAQSARLYGLASAQEFAHQQPHGRLLDPAEVAEALVFLASGASSAMTGAVVPVDGGLAL